MNPCFILRGWILGFLFLTLGSLLWARHIGVLCMVADVTTPAPPAGDMAMITAPPPGDTSAAVTPPSGAQPAPVDQSAQAPGATPSAPAAPAAPAVDVKSEQFGWPDTVELSEAKGGLIQAVDNQAVAQVFRQASDVLAKMANELNDLIALRKKLYETFFDIDAKLDTFYQETSLGKGSVQVSFTPFESKKK